MLCKKKKRERERESKIIKEQVKNKQYGLRIKKNVLFYFQVFNHFKNSDYHFTNLALIPTRFDFCESIEIQVVRNLNILLGINIQVESLLKRKKKSVHQGIVIVLLNE